MLIDDYNDKYILYFYEVLNDDKENISSFVKNVFLNLSNIYGIDEFGYFDVKIYVDKSLGSFVEVEKIDNYKSIGSNIDTKIEILYTNFFLRFVDVMDVYKCKQMYLLDNYYYVKSDDFLHNYGLDNFKKNIDNIKCFYKVEGLKSFI